MKKWYLFLCCCGLSLLACQNNSTETVTDQEKKEIQQLDSLVTDLAKNKEEKVVDIEPNLPEPKGK